MWVHGGWESETVVCFCPPPALVRAHKLPVPRGIEGEPGVRELHMAPEGLPPNERARSIKCSPFDR
jgi:hypothetical protein